MLLAKVLPGRERPEPPLGCAASAGAFALCHPRGAPLREGAPGRAKAPSLTCVSPGSFPQRGLAAGGSQRCRSSEPHAAASAGELFPAGSRSWALPEVPELRAPAAASVSPREGSPGWAFPEVGQQNTWAAGSAPHAGVQKVVFPVLVEVPVPWGRGGSCESHGSRSLFGNSRSRDGWPGVVGTQQVPGSPLTWGMRKQTVVK